MRLAAIPIAFLLSALSALPSQGADFRVGVVDSRVLARESRLGQDGLRRIQAVGERLKEEIRTLQETYDLRLQTFRTSSSSMSREERERMKDEIERQGRDVKRAAEDAQRKIEREGKKIEEEVQKAVLQTIQEYAAENGFSVVLDRMQCLYNGPSTDITQDVLAFMDARSREGR
jgi:outer membrane protein